MKPVNRLCQRRLAIRILFDVSGDFELATEGFSTEEVLAYLMGGPL